MNDFLEAAAELGLDKDPTILAVSKLLLAADRKYIQQVEEQMAVCERVGMQLDGVAK